MLWAGVDSMAVRYGFAAVAGYLAFGAVLRAWIGWRAKLVWITSLICRLHDLDPARAARKQRLARFSPVDGAAVAAASATFSPEPYAPPVAGSERGPRSLPVLGSSEEAAAAGPA